MPSKTNERVPVGGDGLTRLLKERGTGRVIDEVEVTGDVPALLSAILNELRRHTLLLSALADDDFDPDESDDDDNDD